MDGSRKTEAASPNCREAASEELFDAIKKLRSDGIQSPDLRLPEPLLKVLKLESDSPFARYHVSKALLSCAACLGEGTRSAFLFSAGFSKDITGSPGERVNRSAAVLKMGRRTLYRHIEKAAHEITHLLLAGDHAPALENIDFVTTRTHCRLDLRDDSPTILMDRTVMALRDGFNALDEHLFLPLLRDPELRYYALEGCRLAGVQDNGGSRTVQLRLPRCLNVGESHTFSVSVRLPDHDCLEPVFGFAPPHVHARREDRVALRGAPSKPRRAHRPRLVRPVDVPHRFRSSHRGYGQEGRRRLQKHAARLGLRGPLDLVSTRSPGGGSLSTHTTPAVHSRT